MKRHEAKILEDSTRTKRTRRASETAISIPSCGYDWTEKDLEKLNDEIKQSTGRSIAFKNNEDCVYGDFKKTQSKIFIAPTAVLQQEGNAPIYGAFAKESFSSYNVSFPFLLGEYKGTLKKTTEKCDLEKSLYTFDLGNGFDIDAEHEGSWLRMINSTSSEKTANVYYDRALDNKIYCSLARPIKAGEQFLGYYGNHYEFDDKRFLHTSDNWQTSFERYQTNQQLYRMILVGNKEYALPNIYLLDSHSIDIPILEKLNNEAFVPQSQQENKTLLHWACETGDSYLLEEVLKFSPNIKIQTRISGYTALHLVLLNNKLSSEEKKIFLNKILVNQLHSQQEALLLKNREDQTVLHIAITQEDIDLIIYILTSKFQKQQNRKYIKNDDIRYCLDKNGWNFILLAISTGSIIVLNTIKPYLRADDLTIILTKEENSLQEIWQDLTIRYNNEKLIELKEVLSSFLDNRQNEALLQKLDSCLPISETVSSPVQLPQTMELCNSTFSESDEEHKDYHLPSLVRGSISVSSILNESWGDLLTLYHSLQCKTNEIATELLKAVTYLGSVVIHIEDEPLLDTEAPLPLLEIKFKHNNLKDPILEKIKPYLTQLFMIQQLSLIKKHPLYNDLKLAAESLLTVCINLQHKKVSYNVARQISTFGLMAEQRHQRQEQPNEKDDSSLLSYESNSSYAPS